MKTCSKCGAERSEDQFYSGNARCKECVRKKALQRYHDKKAECIEKVRKWQEDNPEKLRAYNGKRYAILKAGGDCVPEDFDVTETFPIYAEAIRKEQETGVPHHVDHVIALSRGGTHEASNLQVLTAEENILKGDS